MFRLNVRLQIIAAILALSAAAPVFSTESLPLTFDDIARYVRDKNQNITGAGYLIAASEAETGHLARSYLPILRAEVAGENFKTGPYEPMSQPKWGIEAKINLFRGGRDALEEDIRESQVRATQSNEKKTFATELEDARRTFWSLVFTREMIGHLKEALLQNEQHLAMANRRIQRGLGTETDRLEFEIYHSQIKEDIESLEHGEGLIEMRLTALLGLPISTRFKTVTQIEHIHDDAIIRTPFESALNPDVTLLKANYDGALAQKNILHRWWTPSLDIYGGYFLLTLRERDFVSQRYRYDTVAGIRLTFELFDGLQSKSAGSSAALRAQGFEQQTQQRTRSTEAQTAVAKEDLKHDHELIHYAEERVAQGKKYLARTLDEYNRGVKNSIDFLGATQKYQTFVRQYCERRKNYQVTKAGLLALIGQ